MLPPARRERLAGESDEPARAKSSLRELAERALLAHYAAAAAVIAPMLGLACFSAYLAWHAGDGTAWFANQAAWPNNMGQPPPPVVLCTNVM